MSFYSFDTSSLLNGQRDLFRPSSFPGVWERIEEGIGSLILCVDEVKLELARRDDQISAWAKSQTGLFIPLEEDIQESAAVVLSESPRLIGVGKGRSAADPWVIALALARGGVVVSEELKGSIQRPKIPEACDAVGVRCISLADFVEEQGWVFGR
jgi:hypothetical protein